MPIEVATALIAGIAVVAGTLSGGLTAFLTERWRADRETELREAERRAVRDDLQRSTLLEVQDNTVDWLRSLAGYETAMKLAEAAITPWSKIVIPPSVEEAEITARMRALKLVERVRDEELRAQVLAFTNTGIKTVAESSNYPDYWKTYDEFLLLWRTANSSLGVELRKLM